ALDLDRVVRVLGIQVHLEVERQADFAVDPCFGPLMERAGLAAFYLEELSPDAVVGHDRLTRFDDGLRLPAEAVGDEGERFLQARVAGLAALEQAADLLGGQAAANFSLQ